MAIVVPAPPVLAEEANDPRRLEAKATLERIARDRPEFAAMHLSDIDATEEDVELLGLSFHAQQAALPIFGEEVDVEVDHRHLGPDFVEFSDVQCLCEER